MPLILEECKLALTGRLEPTRGNIFYPLKQNKPVELPKKSFNKVFFSLPNNCDDICFVPCSRSSASPLPLQRIVYVIKWIFTTESSLWYAASKSDVFFFIATCSHTGNNTRIVLSCLKSFKKKKLRTRSRKTSTNNTEMTSWRQDFWDALWVQKTNKPRLSLN